MSFALTHHARTQTYIGTYGDLLECIGIGHRSEQPNNQNMASIYQWLNEAGLRNAFLEPCTNGIFIGHVDASTNQSRFIADLTFPFQRHELLSALKKIRYMAHKPNPIH